MYVYHRRGWNRNLTVANKTTKFLQCSLRIVKGEIYRSKGEMYRLAFSIAIICSVNCFGASVLDMPSDAELALDLARLVGPSVLAWTSPAMDGVGITDSDNDIYHS